MEGRLLGLPKTSNLTRRYLEYGVEIHHAAAAKFQKKPEFPLSYGALFSLHWRSVVIHRSVRTLCEAGWTPITPILIRTLLDIIASAYAVVAKPEDAEYMGFKFMGSYLIQSVKDPDTSGALRAENTEQLGRLRQQLRGADVGRSEELIKNYAPQTYWYRPEYYSPSAILKMSKNDLQFMYRQFSGSAHGGFLGSALFDAAAPESSDGCGTYSPGFSPQRRGVGKTFVGLLRFSGSKAQRTRCMVARSGSANILDMAYFLSWPTPCSPVMEPPAAMQRSRILAERVSAACCWPGMRAS